jgi:hypothetical protein
MDDAAIAAACLAGDLNGYDACTMARARMRPRETSRIFKRQMRYRKHSESAAGVKFSWAIHVRYLDISYPGEYCQFTPRRMRRKRNGAGGSRELEPVQKFAHQAHPTLRMALERAIAKLTQHQERRFSAV